MFNIHENIYIGGSHCVCSSCENVFETFELFLNHFKGDRDICRIVWECRAMIEDINEAHREIGANWDAFNAQHELQSAEMEKHMHFAEIAETEMAEMEMHLHAEGQQAGQHAAEELRAAEELHGAEDYLDALEEDFDAASEYFDASEELEAADSDY